jgi:hypothetical protein
MAAAAAGGEEVGNGVFVAWGRSWLSTGSVAAWKPARLWSRRGKREACLVL